VKKKRILSVVAAILVGVLFLGLYWVYTKADSPVGQGTAQVLTTLTLLAILFLLLVGLGLGGLNSWAIRNHRWIFKTTPNEGTWQAWYLWLWGYYPVLPTEAPPSPTEVVPEIDQEVADAAKRPRRRGRVHFYPYDVRRRAVLDWENRSPLASLTLPQYLEEKFGLSGTGFLKVPLGTFYEWRRDILGLDGPKDTEK